MTCENVVSLGGGHTHCPLRQGLVWPMGLVRRDVRRRRPGARGRGGPGPLTWFRRRPRGAAAEKTHPKNTISHTGTERIKQPLTLLDGCQRAGVYFEHIFERRLKEARS